jgi:hypothetical protein
MQMCDGILIETLRDHFYIQFQFITTILGVVVMDVAI